MTGVLALERTGDLVAGAYVVLLNADSLEVTRALTDVFGAFTIHAPGPGTYRLRTERIGYRSLVTSPFTLALADTLAFELEVQRIVLMISPLVVRGRARECRIIGDQALEVLAVWGEARKALSAVAWSDLQEHFVHELERFERIYTLSFVLRRERRSSTPARHVMPFRSRSVEELEEVGYVTVEADSVVYEAPDAEVFFSPPFLEHHCFWLEAPGTGASGRLGLRFEPVRGRGQPDVQGVFWLDPATAALERLELTYVNVGEWQRERGAAAELAFEQLPDGRWFVERWWIRMPLVRSIESLKGPIWDFKETIVGFIEQGGEVRRVLAHDGRTLFARGRATARGTVVDSTTGTGLAGARVGLAGTDHVTISQADGSYWLPDLPEGQYRLTFDHPRAALFGVVEERDVQLRLGGETSADLAIAAPATIVERRCAPLEPAVPQGLLVGRVSRVETDSVVAGASVRVAWLDGDRLRTLDMRSDSLGVYRACVPRGAPLSVEVAAEGASDVAVPAIFGDSPIHVLHVQLRVATAPPSRERRGRRLLVRARDGYTTSRPRAADRPAGVMP